MPRKAQWPPRVVPKNGRDRVRVKGDDIYLGPEGSEESKTAYAQLLARVARGEPARPVAAGPTPAGPAEALTVADVTAEWLEQEGPRYGESREIKWYVRAFAPLLALYGPTAAAQFTSRELGRLQLAMAQGAWQGAAKVGWCANVVNARVGRIKRVWRWAEGQGMLPRGSWANLCTLPPLSKSDKRVRHTAKRRPCQFKDLLAVCKHAPKPVGAMLLLGWWSGMRPGEVRTLRRDEVDTSGQEWLYTPTEHKCSHRDQVRVVVLGPKAQAVLRPWLSRAAASGYVFPPSRKRKGGRTHYSMGNYSKAVRHARLKAGVVGLHAYLARHAAKQRVTRELGLDAARSYLGQKSLGTTNDYGDAVDLELARKAARKLG